MTKQLYIASITFELPVVAESKKEAQEEAEKAWKRNYVYDITCDRDDFFTQEATHIPNDYEMKCIPYGKHEDKTIEFWASQTPRYVEICEKFKKLKKIAFKKDE